MSGTGLRLGLASLVAALVVLPLSPAAAVGAGGVEMVPKLPRTFEGDHLLLEVGDEPTTTTAVLRNLTSEPRAVNVYAVSAEVNGSSVSLGAEGSAAWLRLPRTTVELGPNASEEVSFTTDRHDLPQDEAQSRHFALVMEVTQGASVVVRAASVVEVRGKHSLPPGLTAALLVATILIVVASQGLVWEFRKRSRDKARPEVRQRTSSGASGSS